MHILRRSLRNSACFGLFNCCLFDSCKSLGLITLGLLGEYSNSGFFGINGYSLSLKPVLQLKNSDKNQQPYLWMSEHLQELLDLYTSYANACDFLEDAQISLGVIQVKIGYALDEINSDLSKARAQLSVCERRLKRYGARAEEPEIFEELPFD